MSRRPGALVALLGAGAAVALAVYVFISDFPRGLIVLACVLAALGAAWFGLLRRAARRLLGIGVAALLTGVAFATTVSGDNELALLAVAGARSSGSPAHLGTTPEPQPQRTIMVVM